MSLQSCPACGAMISSRATRCPKCGETDFDAAEEESHKQTNAYVRDILIVVGLALGILLWIASSVR